MNFSFQLLDYDTFEVLSNKKVEIKNTQRKNVYSYKISDGRGIVSFEIDSKERGDFFSIRLIDNDEYESSEFNLSRILDNNEYKDVTKKLYTPNNYQNHLAKLYFKAKISLLFNGVHLKILKRGKVIESFEARSGNPKDTNLQSSDNIIIESTYTNPINKKSKTIYFYYDKDNTHTKYGAIPQGEYYINILNIVNSNNDIQSLEATPFNFARTWGKYHVKIYADKKCNNDKVKININESKIIYKTFYLFSINNNREFGSIGSIGIDEKNFERLNKILKNITHIFSYTKLIVKYEVNSNKEARIYFYCKECNK